MKLTVIYRAFPCVTLGAKGFTNSILCVILRGAPVRRADSTVRQDRKWRQRKEKQPAQVPERGFELRSVECRAHPLKEMSHFASTQSVFPRTSLLKGLFRNGSPFVCVSLSVFVFESPICSDLVSLQHFPLIPPHFFFLTEWE